MQQRRPPEWKPWRGVSFEPIIFEGVVTAAADCLSYQTSGLAASAVVYDLPAEAGGRRYSAEIKGPAGTQQIGAVCIQFDDGGVGSIGDGGGGRVPVGASSLTLIASLSVEVRYVFTVG